MKTVPNICTDLDKVVQWFEDLKVSGVLKENILDTLEFDSDQYPDFEILKQAKEIVYKDIGHKYATEPTDILIKNYVDDCPKYLECWEFESADGKSGYTYCCDQDGGDSIKNEWGN